MWRKTYDGYRSVGLALALVAGLAITNMKLLAILVTAATIELTWFLRQRWAGRRRQLYALNTHDLSVLETQAKGVNVGAKLVHPGGAKLVHLTLCGTRCWGVVPVVHRRDPRCFV